MNKVYDLIVVGGGPGGYTAALYGARAGLRVLVLERLAPGGQMALTHQVDNYPGVPQGVNGYTLAQDMYRQAVNFGAESVFAEVLELELSESPKVVRTDNGIYYGRTVVISTGADARKLELPREEELTGKGVAYCAACDGMFYKGKTVAVVGGGNTALTDALLLSRVAQKVYLIHRREEFRADEVTQRAVRQAENVHLIPNAQVSQLLGQERLAGIRIRDVSTGFEKELACDGLFVSIGRKPASALAAQQLALDEGGYIVAGEDTVTSIPGVFAVGDVRTKQVRQIVTALADGAIAVHEAEKYLARVPG